MSNEDDPFSAFKSSIDQLQQCNENLIWNDFTYKDILTADNDIAVMGDEEIVQDLIEVAKEDVPEEDEEVTDETIAKPRADKLCQAIDTLVNFSMFSQIGEIGTTALKAAKLFEKELCQSMKQTFISEFFKKNHFLTQQFYIGFYMYLYFYIDSKYETCMRFLKCFFFIILLSQTFSKSPIY